MGFFDNHDPDGEEPDTHRTMLFVLYRFYSQNTVVMMTP